MTEKNEMIFGLRAVLEALQAGKEIDKVLMKKDLQGDLARELLSALKGTTVPLQRVPVERLNRITRKNHQGVVAYLSAVIYQRAEDLVPLLFEEGRNPFFLALDGITDVRNFGAIARTCECAGVDAVVIPAANSVSVNADAIKTSAGALHKLPVCRERNLPILPESLDNACTYEILTQRALDQGYTAIAVYSFTQALQVEYSLRKRGLRVPQDMSLLTFNNPSYAEYINPAMTCIEIPTEEMGLSAARLLIAKYKDPSHCAGETVSFKGKLIQRESTGPYPCR